MYVVRRFVHNRPSFQRCFHGVSITFENPKLRMNNHAYELRRFSLFFGLQKSHSGINRP